MSDADDELSRVCPECGEGDFEPAYPNADDDTLRAAIARCQECDWQGYYPLTWPYPGWIEANESEPEETRPGQMWLRPDMEANDGE